MKKLACGALLLAAVAATPAHADSCGGNLIDYIRLENARGAYVGQLQFYYNPDNGNNCAIVKHSDSIWGQPLRTHVRIFRCESGTSCTIKLAEDDATYKYEAGPIRAYGKGICTVAIGGIGDRYYSTPHRCQ